jgi:hypothetical protein
LRHQLPCEPRSILYDYRADPVTLDPVEQFGKAAPALDRIGAANPGIGKFGDEPKAGALREILDRRPLSLLAVLISAIEGYVLTEVPAAPPAVPPPAAPLAVSPSGTAPSQ